MTKSTRVSSSHVHARVTHFQSLEKLKLSKQAQEVARSLKSHACVARAIFGESSASQVTSSSEERVVDELERKYELLLDKLLEQVRVTSLC